MVRGSWAASVRDVALLAVLAFVAWQSIEVRAHQRAFGSLSEPIQIDLLPRLSMQSEQVHTTTFCYLYKGVTLSHTVTTKRAEGQDVEEWTTQHREAVDAAADGLELVECP